MSSNNQCFYYDLLAPNLILTFLADLADLAYPSRGY